MNVLVSYPHSVLDPEKKNVTTGELREKTE